MPSEPEELLPTRWTLIQRLKNLDDQEGWREFFNTYWTLLYGTARRSGLAHAEAEEVVQNTVISVCKNIKTFRADPAFGSFKAWLLQQTRWRIADQVRKRPPEERSRFHRAPGNDSRAASTPTEERIPDANRDPLEVAWDEDWEKTLTNAAMESVKSQVSARDLQVFVMITFQGASAQSVAQLNEMSLNHVYVTKHRIGELFEKAVEELKRRWG